MSLLTADRTPLDAKHWLQFDAKNQEFYGIPKYSDIGQKEYLLVAEDREGLIATDALVVVVGHALHREYTSLFEITLGMSHEDFNNSATQRRFVERIAQIFNDALTSNIQIRAIRRIHQTGKTLIHYYNTTLYRPQRICPTETIEQLKKVVLHPDGSVRHRVKDQLGSEFDLNKINVVPMGACTGMTIFYNFYYKIVMLLIFFTQILMIPFIMVQFQLVNQMIHHQVVSKMIIF